MIIAMTNKSIELLSKITQKDKNGKNEIAKQVIEIEYKKIIAQTKNFNSTCSTEKLVNVILDFKDSNELFEYLDGLSVAEISLLSSYGIDVAFMNLLKVSD